MTYDNWKTTEPDPHADEYLSECDCCGKMRPHVTRCWTTYGLETFACWECQGNDEPWPYD